MVIKTKQESIFDKYVDKFNMIDICNQSTKLEFGTLSAHWGYGSKHDGERYELQLCEKCFFYALATLRKERADEFMFDENFDPSTLDGFGLK